MRNDLLEQIVIASGGVITNPHQRNSLLQDWLNAVESPPVNYVARLDGASQDWSLSAPISVETGDVISFDFLGFENNGLYKRFLGSSNFNLSIDTGADGDKFRTRGLNSASINGNTITSDVTIIPVNGVNSVSITVNSPEDLGFIGGLGGSNLISAALFNFKVVRNGVVIHEIPLTNKEQGATQIATVGGVNATMSNYTADVWEARP